MKVSEIMTKSPVCCWASSSTLAAALLMLESGNDLVPVVQDPFTHTLVGVITDRDLCLHVVAGGRDPASTWVDGCMTRDPACCTEAEDTSRALELMKTQRMRRLPVVNEQHEVVGLVSLEDVLRTLNMDARAILEVLRSITEPTQKNPWQVEGMITAA